MICAQIFCQTEMDSKNVLYVDPQDVRAIEQTVRPHDSGEKAEVCVVTFAGGVQYWLWDSGRDFSRAILAAKAGAQ